VLHNNVGVATPGGTLDVDMDDWNRAFNVNLSGIVHACKAAVPYMARRKSGSIINVSSISSLRVLSGLSYIAYPSSKAALNHLTRVMAVEFAPDQVRCNAILPGFIHTPMVEHSVLASLSKGNPKTLDEYLLERTARIPMARWGDAWDVANAAVFLASDESRYITGLELVVDGGATLVAG
jgi:NAD(P)-dependent dehydrogenase (short-subunit alcohol dehydrogenase family)